MCYSVLQCVAVCCSVLQCVAVCCSALQHYLCVPNLPPTQNFLWVAVCCIVLQGITVWCSTISVYHIRRRFKTSCVLQWVAMSCNALQCVAVWCSSIGVYHIRRRFKISCVLQCAAMGCNELQCVAVWCSTLACATSVANSESLICGSVLQCVAVCCSRMQRHWRIPYEVPDQWKQHLALVFCWYALCVDTSLFCTDKARQKKQRLTVLNRYRRAKTLAEMRRFVCWQSWEGLSAHKRDLPIHIIHINTQKRPINTYHTYQHTKETDPRHGAIGVWCVGTSLVCCSFPYDAIRVYYMAQETYPLISWRIKETCRHISTHKRDLLIHITTQKRLIHAMAPLAYTIWQKGTTMVHMYLYIYIYICIYTYIFICIKKNLSAHNNSQKRPIITYQHLLVCVERIHVTLLQHTLQSAATNLLGQVERILIAHVTLL